MFVDLDLDSSKSILNLEIQTDDLGSQHCTYCDLEENEVKVKIRLDLHVEQTIQFDAYIYRYFK